MRFFTHIITIVCLFNFVAPCLGINEARGDSSLEGIFAAEFGRKDCAGNCSADLDNDGDVDGDDLIIGFMFKTTFATPATGIQAAIDECGSPTAIYPCKVIVTPGTYAETDIKIPSNVTIELKQGSNVINNVYSIDVSVFKNKDIVNGNENIHIIGEGIIDGSCAKWTHGEQFAVNFNNVKNSSVECYIKCFSHLDLKRKNCTNITYKNLYYERMDKNPKFLCQWSQGEWNSKLISGSGPGSRSLVFGGGPTGGNFCQLKCAANQAESSVRINWYAKTGDYLDVRYCTLGIWVKFTSDLTTEQLMQFSTVYLWVTGEPKIIYADTGALFDKEWHKIYVILPARYYYSDLSKLQYLQFTLKNTSASNIELDFGDITLEPLQNNSSGRVCFSSDDGWYDDALVNDIIKSYGFPYNMAVSVEYPSLTTHAYSAHHEMFLNMQTGGDGIGSHSVTHNVRDDNFKWEMLASKAILKEDGFGDTKVFVTPGGYSVWSGKMNCEVPKYYSVERSLRYAAFEKNFFTIVDLKGNGEVSDALKQQILQQVQSHLNVGLYMHALYALDTYKIYSVCSLLQEYGIDVLSWDEMFKDVDAKCQIALGDYSDILTNVAAADVDFVYPAVQNLSGPITLGIQNPDVPRNISVTQAGSGTAIGGIVTISGINARGEEVSEKITIASSNGSYFGKKPFKVITQIDGFNAGNGQTLSVGISDSLGFSHWVHRTAGVYRMTRNGVDKPRGTIDRVNGTINCLPIASSESISIYYRGFTFSGCD